MELNKNALGTTEVLSVRDWATQYGGGISNQAVGYLMKNGKIDYVWLGRQRFVALTALTRSYTPSAAARRRKASATA